MDAKKIFLLGIAKVEENQFKMLYFYDFKLINENYKGYFIESKFLFNNYLFNKIEIKDLNKWYKVDTDYYGNILYLYYKKQKIKI